MTILPLSLSRFRKRRNVASMVIVKSTTASRTACAACRLAKCFEQGMQVELMRGKNATPIQRTKKKKNLQLIPPAQVSADTKKRDTQTYFSLFSFRPRISSIEISPPSLLNSGTISPTSPIATTNITHSPSPSRPSMNNRSYLSSDASETTPSNRSCRRSPPMSSISTRRTPISSPCRHRLDRLFSAEPCYPSPVSAAASSLRHLNCSPTPLSFRRRRQSMDRHRLIMVD